MNAHLIHSSTGYLQQRAPGESARIGYRFTADPALAWTFPSQRAAAAKCRVLERHMLAGSDPDPATVRAHCERWAFRPVPATSEKNNLPEL